MKVRFKKLTENAVMPVKAHASDAGFDLVATRVEPDEENGAIVYGTGIAVEIPEGHVGLLFPRSSIYKTDLSLTNGVGVIDSGYRGEVMFKFKGAMTFYRKPSWVDRLALRLGYVKRYNKMPRPYHVGDRIGQLVIMPYPEIEFEKADELSKTDRGASGYGSSGN